MFQGDDDPSSVGGPSGILGAGGGLDALVEPDFGFDADGNFLDFNDLQDKVATPPDPPGATMPSDAGVSARVRQEHKEGQRAEVEVSLPAAV